MAPLFFTGVCQGFQGFILLGFMMLVSGLTSKQAIVLTNDYMLMPKNNFSKKIISIYYGDI